MENSNNRMSCHILDSIHSTSQIIDASVVVEEYNGQMQYSDERGQAQQPHVCCQCPASQRGNGDWHRI